VFGLEEVSSHAVNCISFDPQRFFAMNEIEWIEGDPARAIPLLEAGAGVIVAEQFLTARGLGVGDRLGLGVGDVWQEFEIAGVVTSAGLDLITQLFGIRSRYLEYAVSCVFMDAAVVNRIYGTDTVVMMQVNLAEDISDDEANARILEVAPGVLFRSGRWIRTTIEEFVDGLQLVQTTVALGALVLAAIAVGNVLAAAVDGRRFEYGVLRAVGATPGMLIRLVLAESALMAVAGAINGAAFGVYLSWIDIRNLRSLVGLPLHPNVPTGPILVGACILLVLTLLAVLPGVVRLARKPPAALVAVGRNE
jgi:putative ABC transport system permease protein